VECCSRRFSLGLRPAAAVAIAVCVLADNRNVGNLRSRLTGGACACVGNLLRTCKVFKMRLPDYRRRRKNVGRRGLGRGTLEDWPVKLGRRRPSAALEKAAAVSEVSLTWASLHCFAPHVVLRFKSTPTRRSAAGGSASPATCPTQKECVGAKGRRLRRRKPARRPRGHRRHGRQSVTQSGRPSLVRIR